MGVLVKGMEMPKNCGICGFKDGCEFSVPLTERPFDCPIIKVPPHGRLIDADKIRYHSGTWEKGFDWVMQSEIALMPTVIPADKDGEI